MDVHFSAVSCQYKESKSLSREEALLAEVVLVVLASERVETAVEGGWLETLGAGSGSVSVIGSKNGACHVHCRLPKLSIERRLLLLLLYTIYSSVGVYIESVTLLSFVVGTAVVSNLSGMPNTYMYLFSWLGVTNNVRHVK